MSVDAQAATQAVAKRTLSEARVEFERAASLTRNERERELLLARLDSTDV